jgi:hypothetical protein
MNGQRCADLGGIILPTSMTVRYLAYDLNVPEPSLVLNIPGCISVLNVELFYKGHKSVLNPLAASSFIFVSSA